jgi:hypothetical protein
MFSGESAAGSDELLDRIDDPALVKDLERIGLFVRRVIDTEIAGTVMIQCDLGHGAFPPTLGCSA